MQSKGYSWVGEKGDGLGVVDSWGQKVGSGRWKREWLDEKLTFWPPTKQQ